MLPWLCCPQTCSFWSVSFFWPYDFSLEWPPLYQGRLMLLSQFLLGFYWRKRRCSFSAPSRWLFLTDGMVSLSLSAMLHSRIYLIRVLLLIPLNVMAGFTLGMINIFFIKASVQASFISMVFICAASISHGNGYLHIIDCMR